MKNQKLARFSLFGSFKQKEKIEARLESPRNSVLLAKLNMDKDKFPKGIISDIFSVLGAKSTPRKSGFSASL